MIPQRQSQHMRLNMHQQGKRYISHIRERWSRRPGDVENSGGITVVTEIDEATGVMKVAIAVCSANDTYDRRVGRELAMKRMDQGEYLMLHNAETWFAVDRLGKPRDWDILSFGYYDGSNTDVLKFRRKLAILIITGCVDKNSLSNCLSILQPLGLPSYVFA